MVKLAVQISNKKMTAFVSYKIKFAMSLVGLKQSIFKP